VNILKVFNEYRIIIFCSMPLSILIISEEKMLIKDIRLSTGMTQRSFADTYHIPLQTLKQWESDPESSAYRTPPVYVVYMLERLTIIDQEISINTTKNQRVEDIIKASEHSRYNTSHWFRYLRKEFDTIDKMRLTNEDINALLQSDKLTMFQKVSLKQAANPDSVTSSYISSLNKKASTTMVDRLKEKYANVEK